MAIYPYRCPVCGPVDRNVSMNAPDEVRNQQACDCGETMMRDLAAQFRSQQVSISPYWLKVTASDFLPDEVKGSAPFSKERLAYGERTEATPPRWGRPHVDGHRI